MKFLVYLSDYMIPLIIFCIVGYGLLNRSNVYDDFVHGAADGLKTVIGILPTLIGLMMAVGILRASGFLDFLAGLLGILTEPLGLPAPVVPAAIGFPGQLVPLTIVKMFSSSAATGLVLDLFKEYGPDSKIGMITSIMMSCTETIFYTMSVYYMTAKVKKSRWTLSGALFTTLVGIIASVILAGFLTN